MSSLFALHRHQGKQALRELWGKPLGNLLTVLALALSLSLPASLFVLTKNVLLVTDKWESPNQITVYLNKLPPSDAKKWAEAVALRNDVAKAEYISPEQGLRELRQIQGFSQAVNLLEDNPLPAAVIIIPATNDIQTAATLADWLEKDNTVNEVRVDKDWLERLSAIASLLILLTSLFSGLMIVAVILIIGNTLRLQVLNQKQEIQVLKLVGATDSYILRPYLYTGVWLAIGGASLAWLLTVGLVIFAKGAVGHLANLYNTDFNLSGLALTEASILIIAAILSGMLAAKIAAAKHMREIEPV